MGFDGMRLDLEAFIFEQIEFSKKTFGPGQRLDGNIQHIKKELKEVEACQGMEIDEWSDVILLALDGAWRSGHTPAQICESLRAKLGKNKARRWPDWRTAGAGAIEHIRDEDSK